MQAETFDDWDAVSDDEASEQMTEKPKPTPKSVRDEFGDIFDLEGGPDPGSNVEFEVPEGMDAFDAIAAFCYEPTRKTKEQISAEKQAEEEEKRRALKKKGGKKKPKAPPKKESPKEKEKPTPQRNTVNTGLKSFKGGKRRARGKAAIDIDLSNGYDDMDDFDDFDD